VCVIILRDADALTAAFDGCSIVRVSWSIWCGTQQLSVKCE